MSVELYHDNFQDFKRYNIPKAQLVIADIPYNIGVDAYASNPMWYNGGDNKNGESKHAKATFFNSDGQFKIAEYMHFCNRLLIKEPKEKGKAPAMIVFCAFEQIPTVIEYGKKYGFMNSYPLFFIKHYSAQVLKANMKIVGATEFVVVLYRDKLPKFNNGRQYNEDGKVIRGSGKMMFDWFEYKRDGKEIPKIHPTQKPVNVLKRLIEIFTDEGDVVIDPVAGSGSTLRAAVELNRNAYGFEVDRNFYQQHGIGELKMTDNEIIKALECCNKPVGSNSCVDCPLYEIDNCSETMIIFALDLIKRQKAEIERLQTEKDNLIKTYKECALEVVKEFAERLKDRLNKNFSLPTYFILSEKIDNILKEMEVEG